VFGSGKYGVVSFSRRLGRIVACLLLVAGRLLARAKSAQAAKIAATLDQHQGLFATTTNQLSRLSRQDSRLNRSPPIALPSVLFFDFQRSTRDLDDELWPGPLRALYLRQAMCVSNSTAIIHTTFSRQVTRRALVCCFLCSFIWYKGIHVVRTWYSSFVV
jgi:hypothetical protein